MSERHAEYLDLLYKRNHFIKMVETELNDQSKIQNGNQNYK